MVQAQALAAMQQAEIQKQLLAQQLLMQQQALGGVAAAAAAGAGLVGQSNVPSQATKKQREVYVGNLAIGIINETLLREFFNGALAMHVPDPATNPPVINVNMDAAGGRYAFVELRTEELTNVAMQLDKTELCGRPMNVGRPKGYVEMQAKAASATQAKLGLAQQFAAQLSGGVTTVVQLENLLNCAAIRDERERKELYEDVQSEAVKCGAVVGIVIPVPPAYIPEKEPCRVLIQFAGTAEAKACKEMMDGRRFDDNTVKATYVTEVDFNRARMGEWVLAPAPVMAMPSMPMGMPTLQQSFPNMPNYGF